MGSYGKQRNGSRNGETPTVVDLFCGAGGLSLGLSQSGLMPIHAVDHFGAAVGTYAANIDDHVTCEEIADSTELPAATVFVGGPPCQGFSSAGMRRNGDSRNSLVKVFARLIATHRPEAFVFENVEGFLTTEGGCRVLDLLDPLVEAGYQIHLRKVNAANYGVPQHRKRVIAIGGLGWEPKYPEPTHFAYGAPGASRLGHNLPPTPSIIDVLGDLPEAARTDEDSSLSDHFAPPLSEIDQKRASLLKPGQKMRDLPESLRHPSFSRRANRRVKDGTPSERRGGAPSGIRRLLPDEPSKAITAAARNEFIHPTQDRPLTLRECAKLQTFPDTFTFVGSVNERALLIGNAVPPLLAYTIGLALLESLDARKNEADGGRLLSFIPTASNGMSPALQCTHEMIRKHFGLIEQEKQMLLWQ